MMLIVQDTINLCFFLYKKYSYDGYDHFFLKLVQMRESGIQLTINVKNNFMGKAEFIQFSLVIEKKMIKSKTDVKNSF